MAFGMKGWLALVVGSCAAVAASLLPPERIELEGDEKLPEQIRHDAVLSELRQAHMTLQLTRWSDSLSALLGSEALTGDHPLRVGAFWQPVLHGAMPDVPLGIPILANLTFADLGADQAYCFTVHTHPGTAAFEGIPVADLPSPCQILDRFGVPGARIGEWLDRGAWEFAVSREPIPDHLQLRDRSYADLPLFGTRRHPFATRDATTGGCLAGDPVDCSLSVTDPVYIGENGAELRRAMDASPVSYADLDWADESPFGYLDDTLFADLERQFGAEAFARFWSSDQEVPAAFRNAFGVDLGEWVLGWVDQQLGVSRAGPSLPLGDLLLSIGTLSLFAAIASGAAISRRV